MLFWCFERSDFDPFPTKSAAGDPRRPSLAVVSAELCSGAAAPPKRRRCHLNSYRGFRCPNFPTYIVTYNRLKPQRLPSTKVQLFFYIQPQQFVGHQNSYPGFRCPNFPTYIVNYNRLKLKMQNRTQCTRQFLYILQPKQLINELLILQFSPFWHIRTQDIIYKPTFNLNHNDFRGPNPKTPIKLILSSFTMHQCIHHNFLRRITSQ